MIFLFSSFSIELPRPVGESWLHRYVLDHVDKLVHFLIFATLSWLVIRALRQGHGLSLPTAMLLAILITSAYGGSDEWHQRFTPNRDADVIDWLTDTCGAVLAALVYYKYDALKSSKTNR